MSDNNSVKGLWLVGPKTGFDKANDRGYAAVYIQNPNPRFASIRASINANALPDVVAAAEAAQDGDLVELKVNAYPKTSSRGPWISYDVLSARVVEED